MLGLKTCVHHIYAIHRYDVIILRRELLDFEKIGKLTQNNIPIMNIWSKSKPKIEFQYGGR